MALLVCPASMDGAFGGFAQECVAFGEELFDGVEVDRCDYPLVWCLCSELMAGVEETVDGEKQGVTNVDWR